MKFFETKRRVVAIVLVGVFLVSLALIIKYCPLKSFVPSSSSSPVAIHDKQQHKFSKIYNKIAVIDLKRIAAESKAGSSIEERITEINESAKKDLQELESKMKTMENNKLSEDDTRKLEDTQFVLHDMVNAKRSQISDAYKKAVYELELGINKSIEQISTQHNISIVLPTDAVVFVGSHCYDITDDVIKIIDETCPHISVEVVMKQK